jgi:hypothetical protein
MSQIDVPPDLSAETLQQVYDLISRAERGDGEVVISMRNPKTGEWRHQLLSEEVFRLQRDG